MQTDRLKLRSFKLDDAKRVQELAGDVKVYESTLNVPHPYEDGMAETWISSLDPKSTFAIELIETGELIGTISLSIHERHDKAELAYWIGHPYWNKGYCTEAARLVLKYGFETLQLNRIFAYAMTSNPGSYKVMEKIGMSYEGLHKEVIKKDNIYYDLVSYAILRQK